MIEFLIAAMQGLCIVGLLCGAYYSIVYGADTSFTPGTRCITIP